MYTTADQSSFPEDITEEVVPIVHIKQVPESLDLRNAVSRSTQKAIYWLFVLGFGFFVGVSVHQIILTEAFIKAHR